MNEPRLDNAATWPNLLRAAGYYTGVVGKWHVNNPPGGYDYTAVLPGQGMYFDPPILIQGQMSRGKGHTDDVIGEEAIGFLNRRPANQPFALLYQFKAPHRGWEPAPRFANAFADVEIPPPPDLYESLASRPLPLRLSDMRLADMPDYRNRGVRADMPEEERARLNWQHFIKDYYRVLLGVDENVGRFLDYLDAQGLSENTLIVYTSDNGFFLGENGLFDKRLMYEPSIRVPMLVRHPASIPAGQVNREHMLLNVDVAPDLPRRRRRCARARDAGTQLAASCPGQAPVRLAQGLPLRIFRVPGGALRAQASRGSDEPVEAHPLGLSRSLGALRPYLRSGRGPQPCRTAAICRSGGRASRTPGRASPRTGRRRSARLRPGRSGGPQALQGRSAQQGGLIPKRG